MSRVTANLDYVEEDGVNYDRLCLANLETEHGLMGRVVQDVVTRPVRKWARLQGKNGALEWICGIEPGKDAVKYPGPDGEVDGDLHQDASGRLYSVSFGTLRPR